MAFAANTYHLKSTKQIISSSEAGDKLKNKANVLMSNTPTNASKIIVNPNIIKQKIKGIGSSFTESSAYVLAHLPTQKRLQIMAKIFSNKGANFSLMRTVIGATDFTVTGKYSYAELPGDAALKNFSIEVDKDGFDKKKHQGIQDDSFDILPMIKEALVIKNRQTDNEINIIASAWTAPPWMKDINQWYIKGSVENNYQGTGGTLKEECALTYANYLVKYLDAYKNEGVDIWGLTPVNEPQGNSGSWESMHFSPQTQNVFIKKHLGPVLKASNYSDVKLLIYDQNRDHLEEWANTILSDKTTASFVYGTAVHWYASTFKVYEELLEKIHQQFPNFPIINTEAAIDSLGVPAGPGIQDPEKFQEKNWFNNDNFWWNKNATDWAYSATWAPKAEDHPIYTPVHRYARDIIVGLNHWLEGWIDWNVVLDEKGGPNHAGNFCGAPIMINTKTQEVYYTPLYYILSQFSKTIRPDDYVVQVERKLHNIATEELYATATINKQKLLSIQVLNTTKKPLNCDVQIGSLYAPVNIEANSLQTIRVQL